MTDLPVHARGSINQSIDLLMQSDYCLIISIKPYFLPVFANFKGYISIYLVWLCYSKEMCLWECVDQSIWICIKSLKNCHKVIAHSFRNYQNLVEEVSVLLSKYKALNYAISFSERLTICFLNLLQTIMYIYWSIHLSALLYR